MAKLTIRLELKSSPLTESHQQIQTLIGDVQMSVSPQLTKLSGSTDHRTCFMLADNQNKTNIGVGVGIILQIAGRALSSGDDMLAILGLGLLALGAGFFIWGCMNYAEGKGHSKWLGVLGLLSCLGLLVLVVLPDHYKDGQRRKKSVKRKRRVEEDYDDEE